MRITAQEEYGLRCLLQLARHHGDARPLTVREVATREGISIAYAEKLLHHLARAGLAVSVRGVKGGFRLKGTPEDVTAGDVVRALGGFLTHAAICQRFTGDESRCVHNRDCGLRPVWSTLNYHIQKLLDGIPLALLLASEKESRHQVVGLVPLPLAPRPTGAA